MILVAITKLINNPTANKRVGVPTGRTGFSRKMSVMNFQLESRITLMLLIAITKLITQQQIKTTKQYLQPY
jgi:hypothetical protein